MTTIKKSGDATEAAEAEVTAVDPKAVRVTLAVAYTDDKGTTHSPDSTISVSRWTADDLTRTGRARLAKTEKD